MCSVFGLIDHGKVLTTRQKNKILRVLSHECEVRGTDATGIAYNYGGHITIYKRPLAAHRMHFKVPESVNVVLGHTRMTTQGSETTNANNHPFVGNTGRQQFALAHNGMLWNDAELRKSENLPATAIETDTCVAVQLIEQQKTLDFSSLKAMAEKVEGSFVFTVLDQASSIWFVRGNNPLAIFCYDGFMLYASTAEILLKTAKRLHIQHHGIIESTEGDILKIDRYGQIARGSFIPKSSFEHFWRSAPYYGRYTHDAAFSYLADDGDDLEYLFEAAHAFGVDAEDVQMLLDYGCSSDEIEELLYDTSMLREMTAELKYSYI